MGAASACRYCQCLYAGSAGCRASACCQRMLYSMAVPVLPAPVLGWCQEAKATSVRLDAHPQVHPQVHAPVMVQKIMDPTPYTTFSSAGAPSGKTALYT